MSSRWEGTRDLLGGKGEVLKIRGGGRGGLKIGVGGEGWGEMATKFRKLQSWPAAAALGGGRIFLIWIHFSHLDIFS